MRVEARVVGHFDIGPNDYANLEHVQAKDSDYSGHGLLGFRAIGCRFERCRFGNRRLDNFSFGSGQEITEYVECDFDGLRFDHSIGNNAKFVRCSFRNVDLGNWSCFNAEFVDCVFTGRLRKCIFNGTVDEEDQPWVGREKNEFHGNDFSGADLVDVAFRTGIDLEQQRLPSGPDYLYVPDAVAAIMRAKEGLVNWMPGTELHRKAMVIVNVLGQTVEDGQRQLLLKLRELYAKPSRFPREVVDKIVQLLKPPN
ncbi:MAG: hypothetical protein AB7G28_09470 [Pirellulales bacterium]